MPIEDVRGLGNGGGDEGATIDAAADLEALSTSLASTSLATASSAGSLAPAPAESAASRGATADEPLALATRSAQIWVECDDEKVREVSEEYVRACQAYMLLYTARPPPPPSLANTSESSVTFYKLPAGDDDDVDAGQDSGGFDSPQRQRPGRAGFRDRRGGTSSPERNRMLSPTRERFASPRIGIPAESYRKYTYYLGWPRRERRGLMPARPSSAEASDEGGKHLFDTSAVATYPWADNANGGGADGQPGAADGAAKGSGTWTRSEQRARAASAGRTRTLFLNRSGRPGGSRINVGKLLRVGRSTRRVRQSPAEYPG